MAKYTIRHTCGCPQIINLTGNSRTRQWRLDKLESEACFDHKNMLAALQAKKRAADVGLPELIGTDRQISWALTLRQKALDTMDQSDILRTAVLFAPNTTALIVARVRGYLEAKYWIESRDLDTVWRMKRAGSELKLLHEYVAETKETEAAVFALAAFVRGGMDVEAMVIDFYPREDWS